MLAYEQISRQWLAWISAASWQLALLVCLVAVAAAAAKKASARLRHALWLLVLAKVFLPPALTSPVSVGCWGVGPLLSAAGLADLVSERAPGLEREREEKDLEPERLLAENDDATAEPAAGSARRSTGLLSPKLLFGVWIAGACLFWAIVGARYLKLLRALRAATIIDEGPVRIALERIALELRLSRTPELLAAELLASPFLIGLLRPRIVLPQALLAGIDDVKLHSVLTHELVHWKRYDTWIGWLQTLAQSAFWFHPFLWWAFGRLRHERECACDETVLRQGGVMRDEYGEAIVRVLTSLRGRSLAEGGMIGVFERGSKLQNRLEEIMNFELSEREFGWKSRLAVAALAIGLLPMAPAADLQTPAVAQAPAAAPVQAARTKFPQIVKTVPKRGATGVDPKLNEITVKFDRDMSGGMSWTGGPPLFPPLDETRKARWTDRRTCVLPVKLERGAYYRLGINSSSFQNFRSRQGAAALATALYFTTAGASEEIEDRVKVPAIVSIEPANGAKDVPADTKSLRVTFDRPMGDGMSWTGGGPLFPELPAGEKPRWSDDGLTCTLPVSLEPDHDYRIGLNNERYNNFQSKWGVPLKPVVYKFHTKPAK